MPKADRGPQTTSTVLGSSHTLIDLFAGCGGMTAGFVAEGFEPRLSVEWDLPAAATYAANFGEAHTRHCDIADIADGAIPQVDVVIGGPPCQGFSNLGSKDPNDPRNKLWKEYLRVVLAAEPQVFVVENVDRFAKSAEFALLREELTTGSLRRWKHFDHAVLNAADYGVPQRRQRTILVASRVGPVALPKPTHSRDAADDRLPWATVREALSGVPFNPIGVDLPDSRDQFFGERVPGVFKSNELHLGRRPTQRSLERYDHVPPGGGRFDLPPHLLPRCWAEKPTGTTDVMGRMRWEAPSLTIRTEFFKPEKGQYLHPQWDRDRPEHRVNRVITHREAALLQTFPEDFLWCGNKTDIARQIGNAVPTRLAAAIARAAKDTLR
ncbi:MAG: DNA cytosine methyltransferase [Actinobacteria bacterium]|nr:DNA cytosine methyltransferase [Actinomycetota bacterium]MCB9389956.1 DNA cytosine methyltransferase [Acidimicrobiia bacterium]